MMKRGSNALPRVHRQLTVIPAIVYLYNGVNGFWHGFLQLLGIYMIANLFDRFFIDEWWVGTCIGYPILAAIMSGLMQLLDRVF